jgi:hypothetical protein
MTPVPVTRTLLYATQRLYDTLRYVKLYIVVYKFNNKTRAVHTIYKYHYIPDKIFRFSSHQCSRSLADSYIFIDNAIRQTITFVKKKYRIWLVMH